MNHPFPVSFFTKAILIYHDCGFMFLVSDWFMHLHNYLLPHERKWIIFSDIVYSIWLNRNQRQWAAHSIRVSFTTCNYTQSVPSVTHVANEYFLPEFLAWEIPHVPIPFPFSQEAQMNGFVSMHLCVCPCTCRLKVRTFTLQFCTDFSRALHLVIVSWSAAVMKMKG